jgi:hypothetical protein
VVEAAFTGFEGFFDRVHAVEGLHSLLVYDFLGLGFETGVRDGASALPPLPEKQRPGEGGAPGIGHSWFRTQPHLLGGEEKRDLSGKCQGKRLTRNRNHAS